MYVPYNNKHNFGLCTKVFFCKGKGDGYTYTVYIRQTRNMGETYIADDTHSRYGINSIILRIFSDKYTGKKIQAETIFGFFDGMCIRVLYVGVWLFKSYRIYLSFVWICGVCHNNIHNM